jgi:hypothetical protein
MSTLQLPELLALWEPYRQNLMGQILPKMQIGSFLLKPPLKRVGFFFLLFFAVTRHTVCGVSSLSLPELRRRHAGLLPEHLAEIGGRGRRQRFQRTLFEFIRHSIAC